MDKTVKKCPRCGRISEGTNIFCVCCGSRLVDAADAGNADRVTLCVGNADQVTLCVGNEDIKQRLSDSSMKYNGKEICRELRNLRVQFAQANDLPYEEKECDHQGPCSGTCAYCEQKLDELNLAAKNVGIERPMVYPSVEVDRIFMRSAPPTMGMMRAPHDLESDVYSGPPKKSVGVLKRIKKLLEK
ncbi:MAG: hypothetical protein MR308_07990 [Lachnospiraceae bacterium]|nr:hypothetical protein [Lachnospiraceae bacterium]